MQPITTEDLDLLIEEAKAQGKDASGLEEMRSRAAESAEAAPPAGERKETQTDKGTVVIESTGPAREEDFQ